MSNWFALLWRKKPIEAVQEENDSKLARRLNWLDLTALGLGTTIGSSVYILLGVAISQYSGPSIVVSFIVAAFSALFSGMAYAELGARVPKSGSAYSYIYVTIGEFFAFTIGWDVLLEYTICVASVSLSLSNYINAITDNVIKNTLMEILPFHFETDLFAFFITLLVASILIIGVKESIVFSKILSCVNVVIIVFIIISGATKTDGSNWNIDQSNFYANRSSLYCDNRSQKCGTGGFFPFGVYGMIAGIAKCVFAYMGFDAISTTGEEVNNPAKAIPLSIMLTLGICSLLYTGSAVVVSLMIPYYLIDTKAPLVSAFDYVGLHWATYIISIGAIVSLANCLYSALYPLTRLAYAMANDGLIFKPLAYILPRFKTPLVATLTAGFFCGFLAAVLDINELIEMASIGTIAAYIFVSLSVLVLRYRPNENVSIQEASVKTEQPVWKNLLRLFFASEPNECTPHTATLVNLMLFISMMLIMAICFILTFVHNLQNAFVIVVLVLLSLFILLTMVIIWRQPQNPTIETFKVPCLPLVVYINVTVNFYLMLSLTKITWLRFLIWFLLGMIVYFSYGIRKSKERFAKDNDNDTAKIITDN